MKRFLILMFLLSVFYLSQSQNISFIKHDKVAGLSVGYGTKLYNGNQWKIITPPIALTFDYCLIDKIMKKDQSIGLGLIVAHSKAKTEYIGATQGVNYDLVNIGLRGSYHFYLKKKYDVYAGLLGEYIYADTTKYGPLPYVPKTDEIGGLKFSVFAGYRYYFSKTTAFFAEVEYQFAWINIGCSFRFQ
ncbi:MAG: hypothetical protein HY958_01450 [Bacteroidia bacterium]|nr:hypothetical protein [Bacteroidia bacterium]